MSLYARLVAAVRKSEQLLVAKKWVQDAVKNPGRLHKHFGIPEGETIPFGKINKEISRLHKKKESGKLTSDETSLLRALQLGKRLKKMK